MVSKEVYEYFKDHSWPGNVRELQHLIEYAMNIADSSENTIRMEHIASRAEEITEDSKPDQIQITPLNQILESVERDMIERAVTLTNGNVSKAARLLEIPRQTLQNKLKKYNGE